MQSSQTADTSSADATKTVPGKVLVSVNGSNITQPVYDVYIEIRKNQKPGADADRDTILEELISLELMRQESLAKGLDSRESVIATLEQQERTVLASAAIKDFLTSNPTSDESLKAMYDSQVSNVGNEYNARHILVNTEDEAVEIIKQLDNGGSFEELAKEKSTGPTGKDGGKLGWFSPARMVKPFSDATAKLEKGSYTKEPVQTQFGWHIILLDDVRKITPPPFEEIKNRLKLMAANQQLQEHILQLRQSANIEIADDVAAAAPVEEAPAEEAPAEEAPAEEAPASEEPAPAESEKDSTTTEATDEPAESTPTE